MIAVPLSSTLMDRDVWLPMYLSMTLLILSIIVLIPMPETLQRDSLTTETSSLLDREDEEELESSKCAGYLTQLTDAGKNVVRGFNTLFTSPMITALVCTFLVYSLASSAANLYLQYASRRFNWTIAKVRSLPSVLNV